MVVAETAQHAQVEGAIAQHAGGGFDRVEDGAGAAGWIRGADAGLGRHRLVAYLVVNDQPSDTGAPPALPVKTTSYVVAGARGARGMMAAAEAGVLASVAFCSSLTFSSLPLRGLMLNLLMVMTVPRSPCTLTG